MEDRFQHASRKRMQLLCRRQNYNDMFSYLNLCKALFKKCFQNTASSLSPGDARKSLHCEPCQGLSAKLPAFIRIHIAVVLLYQHLRNFTDGNMDFSLICMHLWDLFLMGAGGNRDKCRPNRWFCLILQKLYKIILAQQLLLKFITLSSDALNCLVGIWIE